ncbi:hypothetical protein FB451DRAFT_1260789 [Mycena latifolia]|nr:hypothetical protein FB451DRAFT_1260789 [Mycena latifolia]
MTEVLQALCRHASPPAVPASPGPTTPPICQTAKTETAKTATYVEAVHTATDRAASPLAAKHLPSTSPSLRHLSPRPELRRPDLIFRFDLEPPDRPIILPTPAALFTAIGSKALGGLQLDGLRWTQNGNLTVRFTPGTENTPEHALHQALPIWRDIRPLLGFKKHHSCPRVDTGSSWHSVIVHDVPVLGEGQETHPPIEWLRAGGFEGRLESVHILCSDEDLQTKTIVPVRLALSSRAEAEFLVEHGALLFGSRGRVSHYVTKPRVRRTTSPPTNGTTVPRDTKLDAI